MQRHETERLVAKREDKVHVTDILHDTEAHVHAIGSAGSGGGAELPPCGRLVDGNGRVEAPVAAAAVAAAAADECTFVRSSRW